MHIDDLRALAPMWLSKTEEVREDRAHWATNYTGDIYAKGWISEMYGYSFGAAEVMLFFLYPSLQSGILSSTFYASVTFGIIRWDFDIR